MIYTDDHEPAHVHAIGNGTAKVNLAGPQGEPELVSSFGLKTGDLRKIMRIVSAQSAAMLAEWKDIHG